MKKHQTLLLTFIKSFLLAAALIILFFSSYRLYSYNEERTENEKLAEKVVSEASFEKAVPISVDFEKLKQENNDIIAWLYCEGTPINYPVAQAKDNSYYIHRRTNGEHSLSGTLFADCLNEGDFTDNNTIIYGHNMKNGTMFGTLTKYQNQKYFDEHPKMYLLTPNKKYEVGLIAGVTVNSTSSIYTLPLEDEDKATFIFELLEKSTFKSEYTFSSNDRFVMLSTCSYVHNNARYVLIGLLKEL